MPRSGIVGTYTLPPGTIPQQPNTTIESADWNSFAGDVQQAFNTPTPLAYGGTNAATTGDAATNLHVLSYDTQALTETQQRRTRLNQGLANSIAQELTVTYPNNADLSAVIPYDDTIPQVSEGTHIITSLFTPIYATSHILFEFNGMVTSASPTTAVVYVGRDDTTNALATSAVTIPGAEFLSQISVKGQFVAGATTTINFVVGAGPVAAGNIRFNGSSSARRFGGTSLATLRVWEVTQ